MTTRNTVYKRVQTPDARVYVTDGQHVYDGISWREITDSEVVAQVRKASK